MKSIIISEQEQFNKEKEIKLLFASDESELTLFVNELQNAYKELLKDNNGTTHTIITMGIGKVKKTPVKYFVDKGLTFEQINDIIKIIKF